VSRNRSLSCLQARLSDVDGLEVITGMAEALDRENERFALLESGEPGGLNSEWSFLYLDPILTLTLKGGRYALEGHTSRGVELCRDLAAEMIAEGTDRPEGDAQQQLSAGTFLRPLRRLLSSFSGSDDTLRQACLVGYLGFELFHAFEGLDAPDSGCEDDLSLTLYQTCLRWHYPSSSGVISVLAFGSGEHGNHKPAEIDAAVLLERRLAQARCARSVESQKLNEAGAGIALDVLMSQIRVNPSDAEFAQQVLRAKESIADGECFQIVLSRDFRCRCRNPWLAYRRLCRRNPSPYQFYLRQPEQVIFGASPERALRVCQKHGSTLRAQLYPIAGTRPRGLSAEGTVDPDLDARLEAALRLDSKEIAEHMMLVDLARNDLARIGKPGSRTIRRLLDVDKYSRVMHLVSEVEVDLRPGLDAVHAYSAVMNMGTLTGAPKVRATEIISRLEGRRRGVYGGAVGYWNLAGEMDTAIAIRTAVVRDQVALVSAGAGIVAQSVPETEVHETWHKAAAVLSAIGEVDHEA
jgi:anthranilate synthase component 1